MMTNKHVVKMIIESAQMLSTAHRVLDGKEYYGLSKKGRRIKAYKHKNQLLDNTLYKATHINHPSNVWVRSNDSNYKWLYNHFVELCKEFEQRYKKTHLTETKLKHILLSIPDNMASGNLTDPPLAMPEVYHSDTVVRSYCYYYLLEKIKTKEDLLRFVINCP